MHAQAIFLFFEASTELMQQSELKCLSHSKKPHFASLTSQLLTDKFQIRKKKTKYSLTIFLIFNYSVTTRVAKTALPHSSTN